MQNIKNNDIFGNRLKRKMNNNAKQMKRSQLTEESYIIDANKKPSRNNKGELMITYEKLQDDIVFDIDLSTLHQFGANNMVLVDRTSTPSNN